MSNNLKAVITGDLVNSRQINTDEYSEVLNHLKELLHNLAQEREMRFDIFRGDEFQVVLKDPAESVFIASIIRLSLLSIKVDVRQSIAVAEIDDLRSKVKSSTGQAFVLSGQNLNNMKSELFAFASSNNVLCKHLSPTISLLDVHLSSLTPTKASVLSCYLQHSDESHEHIGKRLDKGRVNTTKLLNASHYTAVKSYLDYVYELIRLKGEISE